ncbi:MAG: hypothetical protein WCI61_04160 [Chloroflexota bacterium]
MPPTVESEEEYTGPIPARTEIRLFVPAPPDLAQLFPASEVRGCGGSLGTDRNDAYRCSLSGGKLLDPCFGTLASGSILVCNPDPWQDGARQSTIDAGTLPHSPVPPALGDGNWRWNWIELATGQRCYRKHGGTAAFVFKGQPLFDFCRSEALSGYVTNAAPTKGEVWYVDVVQFPDGLLGSRRVLMRRVPITVAWR